MNFRAQMRGIRVGDESPSFFESYATLAALREISRDPESGLRTHLPSVVDEYIRTPTGAGALAQWILHFGESIRAMDDVAVDVAAGRVSPRSSHALARAASLLVASFETHVSDEMVS